ncbi:MAG: hypothetical protein JWN40_3271 [Phycisphaerales bacterium]|nr:hypothetical protein [Phycisphaerales bacterium]
MGLETVEIVMDLEDYFKVEIPDSRASACVTVAELQDVIVDLLVASGRDRSPELSQFVWDGIVQVLKSGKCIPRDGVRPDSKWIGDITTHG